MCEIELPSALCVTDLCTTNMDASKAIIFDLVNNKKKLYTLKSGALKP